MFSEFDHEFLAVWPSLFNRSLVAAFNSCVRCRYLFMLVWYFWPQMDLGAQILDIYQRDSVDFVFEDVLLWYSHDLACLLFSLQHSSFHFSWIFWLWVSLGLCDCIHFSYAVCSLKSLFQFLNHLLNGSTVQCLSLQSHLEVQSLLEDQVFYLDCMAVINKAPYILLTCLCIQGKPHFHLASTIAW